MMDARRASEARDGRAWWERTDLGFRDGRLELAGQALAELHAAAGGPLHVLSWPRVRAKLGALRQALDTAGLDARLFYAMKANRLESLLTALALEGGCGIDACSPGEVALARACGFRPEAISVTLCAPSDADLRALLAHPGLWINCDGLGVLERVGRLSPGRAVGLRVNPGIGLGYADNPALDYAGGRTTKFGVLPEQIETARAIARRHRLAITALHVHAGCGYLDDKLDRLDRLVAAVLDLGAALEAPLERLNIGGGLGVPLTPCDRPLDLTAWAAVLVKRLAGRGLRLEVEPGAYLVQDAGVLVLQAVGSDRRAGRRVLYLDGGFNLAPEPAFYGLPCQPVRCRALEPDEPLIPTDVVGNINEALDVWASNQPLPEIRDGESVALLNVGAYGASMASDHCRRGGFSHWFLTGRAAS